MDAVLYPTDFDNSNLTILVAHLSKNCFRVQSNLPYQQLGKPDLYIPSTSYYPPEGRLTGLCFLLGKQVEICFKLELLIWNQQHACSAISHRLFRRSKT